MCAGNYKPKHVQFSDRTHQKSNTKAILKETDEVLAASREMSREYLRQLYSGTVRQRQRGGARKKTFWIAFILSDYSVNEKHKHAVPAEV